MKDRGSGSTNITNPASPAYKALFRPASIAVVGGSESLHKPGGRVLTNIIRHGYGGTLWVVNPGADAVSGVASFKTIGDLPAVPELAIIAIPAPFVPASLEELARIGTRAAIVLTSGFGEKDEKGRQEELRMRRIADTAGMILIGPNCSGFMTPHYSGKFAGIIPVLKPHSIDFISGSGAVVDLVMEQAVYRGLSFCDVVNVGNSAQTGVEDLLALYDENCGPDSAPILMLYLEALKKPGKLLKHARQLTQKGCTIVGIKSGVAGAGARAAASHTGALATDDVTVDALFRKAGIIRVKGKTEMIDVACVLSVLRERGLSGNRVCVVTDAGGPGVMISDELERQGLELPILGERTRERLGMVLPPESSIMNPVDCLPTRTAAQIKEVLRIIEEEEKGNIDIIVIMVANPGMSENDAVYCAVSTAMDASAIPLIPVLNSTTTCAALIQKFVAGGKCYFQDEVPLGTALGKVVRRPRPGRASDKTEGYDRGAIRKLLAGQHGVLAPEMVSAVLTKAGFRLPLQAEVISKEELALSCNNVGYPLVMKVVGPLHKSDSGGVKLGIQTLEAALAARDELMGIDGATAVLVQQMVGGIEVILGASRTDDLGHLVMFGLGGIYAETLKDVQFALAPLSPEECRAMVEGIRGYPILKGIRGQKGISLELLSDYVGRLGGLVTDFPRIREIDINPLKGFGGELFVVDARIIMD